MPSLLFQPVPNLTGAELSCTRFAVYIDYTFFEYYNEKKTFRRLKVRYVLWHSPTTTVALSETYTDLSDIMMTSR